MVYPQLEHTHTHKMNKRTNKFAVEVGSPNISEAVQRIAFSYGYNWIGSGKVPNEVKYTDSKFLCFDSVHKSITWASNKFDLVSIMNQIVNTFEDAMVLFKNPPKVSAMVGTSEIFVNGDVKIGGIVTVDSEMWEKLVKERNAYLGHKDVKKLPVVTFSYSSKSSGKTIRKVALLEKTEDCVHGLDLNDKNRFKRFLLKNVSGEMVFVGFTEE